MSGIDTVIEAKDLSFSYDGGTPVLNGVNFVVHRGELVTLLGSNGAGKSTLLNCVVGQLKPQGGYVLLEGKDVSRLRPRDVARTVAYVPQMSGAVYDYRVDEFVAMGRAPHLGVLQRPGKDDLDLVREALDSMGALHLANKSYLDISGGERQLVSICRAIVQEPRVMIFDEPTAALDCGNQVRVLKLVRDLVDRGFSVVMTSHNPDHPALVGGTVAIFDRRGTIRLGPVDEVLTSPYLSEVYGVDLCVVPVKEAERTACLVHAL